MPVPERLLNTLQKAKQLTLETPGRIGRIVHLPDDAEDVMVVGDLHGHIANFQRTLQRAELAKHPKRHLVLQELIHGPFKYSGGGDKSHQLVDVVSALKCQFPTRVHYLLGNHELAQFTGRMISKGDADLNSQFIEGIRAAYGSAADEIYDSYLSWFRHLPTVIRTKNRFFISHSLPQAKRLPLFQLSDLERETTRPEDLMVGGAIHMLVWGRDTAEEHVGRFLDIVEADWLVSGHIACEAGFSFPNSRQTILDSLAVPAGYGIFPVNRPIGSTEEFRACVSIL